jgi:non-heme chloroperoxidase
MTCGNIVSVLLTLLILSTAHVARAQNPWLDKSPHQSGFVTANGIKFHYLDWGGKGKVLLFLTGASNSAHIFDDIAPKFTDRFRVVALTRRGHGQSDKPETGYDTATLTEDIRQFLDQLKIKRASIAGHSLGGDEMTRFAALYPKRVDKLIYLDAAYDRADLPGKNPFPPPQATKEDRASFAAYREWWKKNRGFWSDAAEADLRETSLAADGTIKPSLSPAIGQAILAGTRESRPDYTKIKAPALAYYALYEIQPWVPADEESRRKAQEYLDNFYLPYQRKNIDKFKSEMKNGRVVELKNSHHYLFITNQGEVVREMRDFLLKK